MQKTIKTKRNKTKDRESMSVVKNEIDTTRREESVDRDKVVRKITHALDSPCLFNEKVFSFLFTYEKTNGIQEE